MNCGIYVITTPFGQQYVGATHNFKKRWSAHLTDLRREKHSNRLLQTVFTRCNGKGFTFTRLLVCSEKDLLFYEQKAIDVLKPRYNMKDAVVISLGSKAKEKKILIKLKRKLRRKLNHVATVSVVADSTKPQIFIASGVIGTKYKVIKHLSSVAVPPNLI